MPKTAIDKYGQLQAREDNVCPPTASIEDAEVYAIPQSSLMKESADFLLGSRISLALRFHTR